LDPALPAALRVAIDQRLEGRAREGLARRASALSEGYRKGRASSALVHGAEDSGLVGEALVLAEVEEYDVRYRHAHERIGRPMPGRTDEKII
jgi:hypothetical protein